MSIIIGTPHSKNSGYYCNDDTPSGGSKIESDIQTCSHCQAILRMSQWKDDGGFCGKCMKPICGPCADRMLTHGCEPFIKKIEESLNNEYRIKQFRKIAGLEDGYRPVIFSSNT